MTRVILICVAALLAGCGEPNGWRQRHPIPQSEIQALRRGDSVIVRYEHDSTLCGPAVVFGIHYENDQLVWVQFPDSTRTVLHESFLWRKP